MENENFKNIPITTILLTYLYICGVLYLVGYWSTFDVDVFSLISIYDIPKSFVFPLLISQLFFLLNYLTGNFVDFTTDREGLNYFIQINPEWKGFKRRIILTLTSLNLWMSLPITYFIINYNETKNNWFFWFAGSFILSYYLLYRFLNLDIVRANIKSYILRLFIGHFLIFFPISCLSTGKIQSILILHNKAIKHISIESKTIKSVNATTDSLKLLGFISDRVIYGTLDNKHIYISNKDSYDTVVLTK